MVLRASVIARFTSVTLMAKALQHIHNVEVTSYDGLTVEFARKMKAKVIVRG
jgi:phosphopantetheine adenylyltransferase